MNFEGLVVTINGAGGGIGRELAVLLRKAFNCHLALCDTNETELKETLACVTFVTTRPSSQDNDDLKYSLTHLRTTIHLVDCSQREHALQVVEDIKMTHGRCELVINSIREDESSRVDMHGAVSTMNLTQAWLPVLQDQDVTIPTCLVNISIVLPSFGNPVSVASQHAIRGFTEALQVQNPTTFNNNVHFANVVMLPESYHRRGLFSGTVSNQEAAKQVLLDIQRLESRIVVGSATRVLDRAFRCMPTFWIRTPFRYRVLIWHALFWSSVAGKTLAFSLAGLALWFALRKRNQVKAALFI